MIKKAIYFLFTYPLYKLQFGKLGTGSWLVNTKVDGHKRIQIGARVYINSNAWLSSNPLEKNSNSLLSIGDETYIGRFFHCYASSKIVIGKKVLIADKVYIADNMHEFKDINTPIIDQPIKQTAEVSIGDGAWLGENVCVIGANIGKQTVIGANSIVTKDIPDYCVAVGQPAKIIKRYSFEKNEWLQTDEQGQFII